MELTISPSAWPTASNEVPAMSQSERVPDVAFSPSNPRIVELWGQEELDENAALNVSAFFSGVALISEAMGMLPCRVYKERKSGGWDLQDQHPTDYCLNYSNNGWQTPSTFKSMKQVHLLLSGNGVASIQRNGRGQGIGLKSFLPVNTRFYVKKNGDPLYALRDAPYVGSDDLLLAEQPPVGNQFDKYDFDEVLHLRAFGLNGYTGLSTIKAARSSLDLTRTIEKFGNKFFNKGRPAGFLTKDGKMQDKQYEKLKDEWRELQEGVMNAFNVGILSGGLKWQAMGYTNDDAQFLQSRAYQVLEIARWLRIPPHLLAQLEKATNSNIEQLMLEFIIHTLIPWIVRWEEEINLKMFTPKEQSMGFRAFFDTDAFLRGDTLTRANVEEKDIRNGVRTIDEVRISKRLNPYEGGIGSKPLIIASQLDTLENVIAGKSPLQGVAPGQTNVKKEGSKVDN